MLGKYCPGWKSTTHVLQCRDEKAKGLMGKFEEFLKPGGTFRYISGYAKP